MSSLIITLLAAACFGPGRYEKTYNEAACAAFDDCGWLETLGWSNVEACIEAFDKSADKGDCADYSRPDAKACIDAWDGLSCEELAIVDRPAACDTVCEE